MRSRLRIGIRLQGSPSFKANFRYHIHIYTIMADNTDALAPRVCHLPLLTHPRRSSLSNRFIYFSSRQEDEVVDPQFEPVIKLTEQVETKTLEEDEDVLFKMCVYVIAVPSILEFIFFDKIQACQIVQIRRDK